MDNKQYSFVEHLSELAKRLKKAVYAIAVCIPLAFFFAPELLEIIEWPFVKASNDQTIEGIVYADDECIQSVQNVISKNLIDLKITSIHESESFPKNHHAKFLIINQKHYQILSQLDIRLPQIVLFIDAPFVLGGEVFFEGITNILQKDSQRMTYIFQMLRKMIVTPFRFHITNPLDVFLLHLKIALVAGIALACPIWLFQIWKFISPGLFSSEKKMTMMFIIGGTFFFLLGISFAYFFVLPFAFKFFLQFNQDFQAIYTISEYVPFVLTLLLAFGVVFQLPLVIAILAQVGLVNKTQLKKFRKYAIVICFIVAGILTPPDPITQVGMAIPLCLFYELGIFLSGIFQRKQASESMVA